MEPEHWPEGYDGEAGNHRPASAADRDTHEPSSGTSGTYSELTMSETITNCGASGQRGGLPGRLGNRMSVEEIARRLDVGRLAVYAMLEQGILPGIRLGRRWIVTRHAFENWERTCGVPTGLQWRPEHKVT